MLIQKCVSRAVRTDRFTRATVLFPRALLDERPSAGTLTVLAGEQKIPVFLSPAPMSAAITKVPAGKTGTSGSSVYIVMNYKNE